MVLRSMLMLLAVVAALRSGMLEHGGKSLTAQIYRHLFGLSISQNAPPAESILYAPSATMFSSHCRGHTPHTGPMTCAWGSISQNDNTVALLVVASRPGMLAVRRKRVQN